MMLLKPLKNDKEAFKINQNCPLIMNGNLYIPLSKEDEILWVKITSNSLILNDQELMHIGDEVDIEKLNDHMINSNGSMWEILLPDTNEKRIKIYLEADKVLIKYDEKLPGSDDKEYLIKNKVIFWNEIFETDEIYDLLKEYHKTGTPDEKLINLMKDDSGLEKTVFKMGDSEVLFNINLVAHDKDEEIVSLDDIMKLTGANADEVFDFIMNKELPEVKNKKLENYSLIIKPFFSMIDERGDFIGAPVDYEEKLLSVSELSKMLSMGINYELLN